MYIGLYVIYKADLQKIKEKETKSKSRTLLGQ